MPRLARKDRVGYRKPLVSSSKKVGALAAYAPMPPPDHAPPASGESERTMGSFPLLPTMRPSAAITVFANREISEYPSLTCYYR